MCKNVKIGPSCIILRCRVGNIFTNIGKSKCDAITLTGKLDFLCKRNASTFCRDSVLIHADSQLSQGVEPMAVTFDTAAELVQKLGNIPLERICFKPPPGTATERDLLAAMRRYDRLYELVDGTLVEKTMGLSESMIAGQILIEIGLFGRQHDLGMPAGADGTVRLLKGLVRIPDVSFFRWDKLPGRVLPSKPIPDLYPDLAVEVLSENNTKEEMIRKLKEYFLAGVRLVWMIDPRKRSVAVYTAPDAPAAILNESQSLDGGNVLPGFTLPLAELFARLPSTTELKKGRSSRKKKS
jgi:Uma2 family endonuclease